MNHTVKMYSACGMTFEIASGDLSDCKAAFNQYVAHKKKLGATVSEMTPEAGEALRVEINEPEDAIMVPDWAGTLVLHLPPTRVCKWCGGTFEPETKSARFCSEECAEAYA